MSKPYNEYDELLGTERHEHKENRTMTWELIYVAKEPDWIQDKSGVYTVIYRIPHTATGTRPADVRLDLISAEDNEPIRSWQGSAAAVRKAFAQWITKSFWTCPECEQTRISAEHCSYIGEQLALAALLPDFVQD